MAAPGPTTRRYTERLAGNLLRLARQRRSWSQRQLVEAAGVPVSTVARIESGARQPSLDTISRLPPTWSCASGLRTTTITTTSWTLGRPGPPRSVKTAVHEAATWGPVEGPENSS
jgi:DNA-binding XRE family transcriptional regulator